MEKLKKHDVVRWKLYGKVILVRITNIGYNNDIVTIKEALRTTDENKELKEYTVSLRALTKFNEDFELSLKMIEKGKFNEDEYEKTEHILDSQERYKKSYETINQQEADSDQTCSSNAAKRLHILNQTFSRPGTILHIDEDNEYAERCMQLYREYNIEATTITISCSKQPLEVYGLLKKYNPDILVLTGHDGVIKGKRYEGIKSHTNSKYFRDAVISARSYERDLDKLVIYAGAAQSCFEEIIKAGANFASSPARILINALDPALLCREIAITSINEVISPEDISKFIITGLGGIGGLETRGKLRKGIPLKYIYQGKIS